MALRWNEKVYGTGSAEIDTEHRQLFEQLNRLLQACIAGHAADELTAITRFLGTYVRDHFSHEERLMLRQGCPLAEVNQQEHRKFMENYQRICKDLEVAAGLPESERSLRYSSIAGQVQTDLCKWFSNHIVAIDTKLRG